jgi:choline dehydrogenase
MIIDLRWDVARAFYYLAEDRKNLVMIRGTGVDIQWEQGDTDDIKRATGLTYIDNNNQIVTLRVSKKVVFTTGALQTPLVLKKSRIGNL